MRFIRICGGALAAVVFTLPAAAAEFSMTATGVSVIDLHSYPAHADGSVSQHFTFRLVQINLEGDLAGETWGADCVGEGLVSADGVYAGTWRCTMTISAEDAFTYEGTDNAEGATFEITGGKGRFAGATGSGTAAYTWGDTVFGDKITFTSEMTLTTP